ncbi:MAG: glycosyl hydrolase [Candidatus Omnitrophota bacterium]
MDPLHRKIILSVLAAILTGTLLFLRDSSKKDNPSGGMPQEGCFTGAFLADDPGRSDIKSFRNDYGKKPYYVMLFTDWKNFPNDSTIADILKEGCRPIVTWEPWIAHSKDAIDIDSLLAGEHDDRIREFAKRLKAFDEEILLRFAHEMNGNWYPWSGSVIGSEKYRKMYRYVKDIFDDMGAVNIKWVFSVNWEDVPAIDANDISNYYPGGGYVDYVGIDGYNWGTSQEWSKWMSFYDIFAGIYERCVAEFGKPVIITEFSSASDGGNKAEWIKSAMEDIKSWRQVKGFVVFNTDKEVDWKFPIAESSGQAFREAISAPHFKDK